MFIHSPIRNVNTDSDTTGGDCPAGSGADQINLPADVYTIAIPGNADDDNLSGDFDINASVSIIGAALKITIIQAGTNAGNGIDRIFHITNGATNVTISDITMCYGRATAASSPVMAAQSSTSAHWH